MAAFGGYLFYDLFSQGQGGPWPPRPPPTPDPLLRRLRRANLIHKKCSLGKGIRTFQQRVSLKTEQETQNNVLMNVHKSGNIKQNQVMITQIHYDEKKPILQPFWFLGEF